MQGIVVPNIHSEFCLCSSVVCPYPFLPSMEQIIDQRLHVHTHIVTWVSRYYQRQEYVLSLEDDAGGKIEGDNENGPTSVRGTRHSIWIEAICSQRNTYITSLLVFLTMNPIEMGPRFSIGWMHKILRIVSSTHFMPCHLFHGFLDHEQSLDPRNWRKVP